MPPPTEHRITTLTGFTEAIEDALRESRAIYGDKPDIVNWYRGCGRSVTHTLKPSLYRHPTITDATELLKLEVAMLEWFRRESILHQTVPKFIDEGKPELELLFFMQHYSVPTRLLDWTMNPFIALYFGVAGAEFDDDTDEYKEDAAVWILSPNAWNERSLRDMTWGGKGALTIDDPERSAYAPRKGPDPLYPLPAAMRGIANNTRMFAQKGVFTIFGQQTDSMETAFDVSGYRPESLVKVIIEKEHIDHLLDSVTSIGYTDSVSYTDLHGLAMEMRRSFGFNV